MRKKDRSPYSFRRKQSLNYLAKLSSKETAWFGRKKLCAVVMRNAILSNLLKHLNSKQSEEKYPIFR